MTVIELNGQITPSGRLEADLPPGLPPGKVRITIQIEETWTEEELAELLRPVPPLTGKEIVEAGLLGGWENSGISDGAAWVEEQRRQQREQARW